MNEEENTFEEILRSMLPLGPPFPDKDNLDYSFAVEYDGPHVSYRVPKVEPIDIQHFCNVLFCLGIEDQPANLCDSCRFEWVLTVRESAED